MGRNNRPKTTETRSISFEKALLDRINEETVRLKIGRSEFIANLALMYFDDPVRLERARLFASVPTPMQATVPAKKR